MEGDAVRFAAIVCDGCGVARVEIPMPDKRVADTVFNAAAEKGWRGVPFLRAELCPDCLALTEIDLPEPETEAMF